MLEWKNWFLDLRVLSLERHLKLWYNEYTTIAWNDGFVQTYSANYYSTCGQNGFFTSKNLFKSSGGVLVGTYF